MMKYIHYFSLRSAAFFSVLPACFLVAMYKQDIQNTEKSRDNAALFKQLREVVKTIREERTAYYERRHAHDTKIRDVQIAIKKLESELEELRLREKETDHELAGIHEEMEQLRHKEKTWETMNNELIPEIELFTKHAMRKIETGIPYKVEERQIPLKKILVQGEQFNLSDSISLLWNFLEGEIRLARSGETFTGEVLLGPDKVKHARLVRIGHHFLAYITEDGNHMGRWSGMTSNWLNALSSEDESSILHAIDVLDRWSAPKLIPLPLELDFSAQKR